MTVAVPAAWQEQVTTTLELTGTPPLWIDANRSLDVPNVYWGSAVTELIAAPGRSRVDDEASEVRRHRLLADRIVGSLRPWNNAGCLELRYVWGGGRLRVLFIARALGRSMESARAWARQLLDNLAALFPHGYEFGPLQQPLPHDITAWTEIERAEEIRTPGPFVPPAAATYYYLIHPLGGSGVAWPSLPRALSEIETPGFLSVALVPTALSHLERQAVDRICGLARHLSQPWQDYDFFGNPTTNPPDAAADDLYRSWHRFSERSGVLARIGVAGAAHDLQRLASLIGSILVDGAEDVATDGLPGRFKVVSDVPEWDAYQTATLGIPAPRYRHDVWSLPDDEVPWSLQRLPYFFSEEEAGGLLILPVPDEHGVPGMARARRGAGRRAATVNGQPGDGVRLGAVLHHGQAAGEVALPLSALNRHALIVGSSGSGKTTTVLTLLAELWRRHRVPFMVIESVKTEYRSLLGAVGFDELQVMTLGREDLAPLRLNPLAPPAGVRCEVHLGAVMAALKLAMPLVAPLPQLLEDALERTYRRAGWRDDTTIEGAPPPPTIRELLGVFGEVFKEQGYSGEAANLDAALKVRLKSLLRGSRGRMLDTVSSTDFQALLAVPVVVELNDVVDNADKALLSAFLLDRIRSGAQARGGSHGQLRHVTVIEEAHRLLGRAQAARGDQVGGDQLQAESVRAFCDAIAELRAMGEGFVLSSQRPSELADAAVANTGVRILHRLETAADRAVILDDLDAGELDREAAARLRPGEALVRWPERDEAELVRVEPSPGVDSGREVPDAEVAVAMAPAREVARFLLPYPLCADAVCPRGCESTVRADGLELAERLKTQVRQIAADATQHRSPLPEVAGLLVDATGRDLQRAYCSAVHLSVIGAAPPPGASPADDQQSLARALREAVDRAQS
ncbi:MAG TPA: ATP-binding protein [Mycobacteriales bacterium]|nr:ATP-binding protein [Mycobacteriales bacterium]